MNKLVYLFELDSVRITTEEIQHAQEALFDEIVKNGNFIACTFNQIVDSPAFLAILKDEKKYQDILKLIDYGIIRVSRYADIRTPSQYVQKALERTLSLDDKNSFIFSSLPITLEEKDLISKINQALKYSDLSILRDEIKKQSRQKDDKSTENKIEKLTILIRFVELMLTFSVKGVTINKPKKNKGKTFPEFINMVLDMEYDEIIDFENSKDILKQIKKNWLEKEMDMMNRSNWLKEIDKTLEDQNEKRIPKAIIDLCYNYAVEDSILGISKHYINFDSTKDSFCADFYTRLKLYLESSKNFAKSDINEVINYEKVKLPDWDIAVRLRNKKVSQDELVNSIENRSNHYEHNFSEEQSEWTRSVIKKVGFSFLSIFFGMFLFLFVDIVIDSIKNIWSMLLSSDIKIILQSFDIKNALDSFNFSKITTTIITVFIFGIFSAHISKKYKVPDLLESFKGMWLNIYDAWRIWKNKKNDAYHRL